MVVCMVFSVSVSHDARGDAKAALMVLIARCDSDCVRVEVVVAVIGMSRCLFNEAIVAQKKHNV